MNAKHTDTYTTSGQNNAQKDRHAWTHTPLACEQRRTCTQVQMHMYAQATIGRDEREKGEQRLEGGNRTGLETGGV